MLVLLRQQNVKHVDLFSETPPALAAFFQAHYKHISDHEGYLVSEEI